MSIMSTPIQPPFYPDGAGYRAGACNIGPDEIRSRRVSGAVGIAGAAVLGLILLATDAPMLLRLVVLLPLWGGTIGLLQAQRRFCVAFAMAGVANFGGGATTRVRVGEEAARRADRSATVRLLRDAFLIAAAITVAFTLLPL